MRGEPDSKTEARAKCIDTSASAPCPPEDQELLADAAENAVDAPAVADAVANHAAPVAPTAERGEAVLTGGILPVAPVGVGVGEGGVLLVDGRLGDRVGLEAEVVVLGRQALVAHVAVLVGFGPGLEEPHLNFLDSLGLGPGHGVHHLAVGVLLPARGVEGLLRGTGAVDRDRADSDQCDLGRQGHGLCAHGVILLSSGSLDSGYPDYLLPVWGKCSIFIE